MPSDARVNLDKVLADVDAQITYAKSFSGGKPGAPAPVGGVTKPGRAFTRGATVLLAGALEGYVEAVVLETAKHLGSPLVHLADLKRQVDTNHGASVRHIHLLTAQIGLPFVVDKISWQKVSQGAVRPVLDQLARMRNKIAHGGVPTGPAVADVTRWRGFVVGFANGLDKQCAQVVDAATGSKPW